MATRGLEVRYLRMWMVRRALAQTENKQIATVVGTGYSCDKMLTEQTVIPRTQGD